MKDIENDRAERHDLKSRLWLFFLLFSSLLKKGQEEKENESQKS